VLAVSRRSPAGRAQQQGLSGNDAGSDKLPGERLLSSRVSGSSAASRPKVVVVVGRQRDATAERLDLSAERAEDIGRLNVLLARL